MVLGAGIERHPDSSPTGSAVGGDLVFILTLSPFAGSWIKILERSYQSSYGFCITVVRSFYL